MNQTTEQQLHEQRAAVTTQLVPHLSKISKGQRLSSAEAEEYTRLSGEYERLNAVLHDKIEERDYVEAVTAAAQKVPGAFGGGSGSVSKANYDLDQSFREAIFDKSPKPIMVPVDGARSYYQPGLEKRDLLKGTATQALPTNVYGSILDHLVENSAVLRAGATVVNTETGVDLVVPKSTAFSTSALTTEGAAIAESDPTLGTVVLKAYKYAVFFEISYELAQDGSVDLLAFLARQAGVSLALAFGNDLINGDGSSKPRGILTDAAVGVTGPTGTSTSLGAQQTVGQGTDLLWALYGSLLEPYVINGRVAWLMRNATKTKVRQLKSTSDGTPMQWPNDIGQIHVDPFVPAMAANAKSMIFGDFSRYFVRISEGVRFERSDHFKFQNDLVCFKAAIRLDAALVDTNAIKVFANSAT